MKSYLTNYQTGEALQGKVSDELAGALADAASESAEGTCVARLVDGVWEYVRPSAREPGDVTVFSA